MKPKKRIIIPLIVAAAIILTAAIGCYIYNETYAEPIKRLKDYTGIELSGSEKLEKYSRYYDSFEDVDYSLEYAYKISFSENDYDDMMEKILNIPGRSSGLYDLGDMKDYAEWVGVPPDKYWLNTSEEEILWCDHRDKTTMVVTKSVKGCFFAYINWYYDMDLRPTK